MKRFRLTSSLLLTLLLGSTLVLFAVLPANLTDAMQFDRNQMNQHQWWRLLTGQLVHYGIYHLLMNLAALLVCGYAFLDELKADLYAGLLIVVGLCVGFGIYWGNPELEYYRGLSGVLHGLIVFGLLVTAKQTPWINASGFVLVCAKLWHEQQGDYEATNLQQLMPVPVAVDAHLYGAIGGLLCALAYLAIHSARQRHSST